jgi:outer membrane murein-binding lipoprotein Lpp
LFQQLACMVSELTEKVKTLESNLEEMKQDAKSVSANQKLDALATNHEKNNSSQDPFRVSLDESQKTVFTPALPHATMKQTQGNESQSKREPLGIPTPRFVHQPSSTQKCRGNENESQQERVKRNLSTWFASTSRMKQEDYQSQSSQDFEKTKFF